MNYCTPGDLTELSQAIPAIDNRDLPVQLNKINFCIHKLTLYREEVQFIIHKIADCNTLSIVVNDNIYHAVFDLGQEYYYGVAYFTMGSSIYYAPGLIPYILFKEQCRFVIQFQL